MNKAKTLDTVGIFYCFINPKVLQVKCSHPHYVLLWVGEEQMEQEYLWWVMWNISVVFRYLLQLTGAIVKFLPLSFSTEVGHFCLIILPLFYTKLHKLLNLYSTQSKLITDPHLYQWAGYILLVSWQENYYKFWKVIRNLSIPFSL